ncbi:MAG: hypothetical protein II468_03640 [Lachnospiraceae bacterium]|nr:hypothetical protein [Lachnospiraceae bacterium]
MFPYKKIIFVCKSNSFSSIMAEAILNHLQENLPEDKRIEVISRGIIVLFPEPINPKAVTIAANNNITLTRETSRQLEKEDITPDSLVITMNDTEKKMIEERYPGIMNLYRLRDFSGEGGEVIESYGGDIHEYQTLFEHLDLMIKLMIEKIWAKEDQ